MREPMRYLLLLLTLSVQQAWADTPVAPSKIEGARTVSAEEVIEQILSNPSLIVIDSRKDEQYDKGHIQHAVNLLNTRMTPETLSTYVSNKETPILFYCNGPSCLRSSNAVQKAKRWGYSHLYWFRGGWTEWTAKKLPIER